MDLRRQAHCVFRCEYHIVWIPRYRYEILTPGVAEYLKIKLDEVRKTYPEFEYIEQSIQPDHVHILISFPPKYSISKVVQILKQNTGRALKQKFDFIAKRYDRADGMWSVGYFVSTVGIDEKRIQNYIKYQQKEDLGQAQPAFL